MLYATAVQCSRACTQSTTFRTEVEGSTMSTPFCPRTLDTCKLLLCTVHLPYWCACRRSQAPSRTIHQTATLDLCGRTVNGRHMHRDVVFVASVSVSRATLSCWLAKAVPPFVPNTCDVHVSAARYRAVYCIMRQTFDFFKNRC